MQLITIIPTPKLSKVEQERKIKKKKNLQTYRPCKFKSHSIPTIERNLSNQRNGKRTSESNQFYVKLINDANISTIIMNKLLKIAIWNANRLSNHIQELKHFVNDNEIDIMMISETHFTSKSYVSIPGYFTYYTLHPDGSAHGGTAIIIQYQALRDTSI